MDIGNFLDDLMFAFQYHLQLDEFWSVIAFAIVFGIFW